MILVADSGSTKTDWRLIAQSGEITLIETIGINPSLIGEDEIFTEISTNLCPKIKGDIAEIYFYGAGVTAEKQSVMRNVLQRAFAKAAHIEAHSDLLGSARSVCGHNAGIACILGTGANSCLYDGEKIIDNVLAGGYILGDEGSGAVLGRNLINAFLKRELSEKIHSELVEKHNFSYGYVVEKVYKTPMANRWMADFTKFLGEHKTEPCIRKILVESFTAFFTKNIEKYENYKQYPVNIIGSIAYYFRDVLEEVANERGIKIGKIIKAPAGELAEYHKTK